VLLGAPHRGRGALSWSIPLPITEEVASDNETQAGCEVFRQSSLVSRRRCSDGAGARWGRVCQKRDQDWGCYCNPAGINPIVCKADVTCNQTLKQCTCPKKPGAACNGLYCTPECYCRDLGGGGFLPCTPDKTCQSVNVCVPH
jgi:hypothetical protein